MPTPSHQVPVVTRWILGSLIFWSILGIPFLHYRYRYTSCKRLRVVEPGKLYRSGMMTGVGLRRTLKALKIKTVINLMEESPEAELPATFFDRSKVSEKEICEEMGVNFRFMQVELINPRYLPEKRPKTMETFIEIMNNPDNYPVLIHCRAGLHRTGVLTAMYRMEFDGWSKEKAWKEMKAHGFGELNCYASNDYIDQYICKFEPGQTHKYATKTPDQKIPIHKVSMDSSNNNE